MLPWIIPVDLLGDDVSVEDLVEPVMEVQGAGGPGLGHKGGDGLQIQRHHPYNAANQKPVFFGSLGVKGNCGPA